MKKTFAYLMISSLLLLALAGCWGGSGSPSSSASPTSQPGVSPAPTDSVSSGLWDDSGSMAGSGSAAASCPTPPMS